MSYVPSDPEQPLCGGGGGWGGVIVDVQIRAVIVILGFKTLNWNPIGQ